MFVVVAFYFELRVFVFSPLISYSIWFMDIAALSLDICILITVITSLWIPVFCNIVFFSFNTFKALWSAFSFITCHDFGILFLFIYLCLISLSHIYDKGIYVSLYICIYVFFLTIFF